MAFKQNREPGSRLGSYTGMQDKGLLNKVKDKITEKREAKAKEKAIASTSKSMGVKPKSKQQISAEQTKAVQSMHRKYLRGENPGEEKIKKETTVSASSAPDIKNASIMNQPWNKKIQTGDWDSEKREFKKIDNPVDNTITKTGYGSSSNPTVKGRVGLPTGKQLTVSHNTSNIKNKNINLSGDLTLGGAMFRKAAEYGIDGKVKKGTGSFTQKGINLTGNAMVNVATSTPRGKLYGGAGVNFSNLSSKENYGSINPTVKIGGQVDLLNLNSTKANAGYTKKVTKRNLSVPVAVEMQKVFNKGGTSANAFPMADQGRSNFFKGSIGIAGGNEYKGTRFEAGFKSNNLTNIKQSGVQPYFQFSKRIGAKNNKKK